MNDEIRSLYAAVGRGETAQWLDGLGLWNCWPDGKGYHVSYTLGDPSVKWRIKPRTVTLDITNFKARAANSAYDIVLECHSNASRDALLKALRGE